MFKTELAYFIEHQEELVKQHNGKILALKGQEILGIYDTPLQAYIEIQKEHKPGTFAIQVCRPGPGAYTVTMSPGFLFV